MSCVDGSSLSDRAHQLRHIRVHLGMAMNVLCTRLSLTTETIYHVDKMFLRTGIKVTFTLTATYGERVGHWPHVRLSYPYGHGQQRATIEKINRASRPEETLEWTGAVYGSWMKRLFKSEGQINELFKALRRLSEADSTGDTR